MLLSLKKLRRFLIPLLGGVVILASSGCEEDRIVAKSPSNGSIITPEVENLFPIRSSETNAVAFLSRGDQLLKSRIDLIRLARHSIHLQTFIWTGDESGVLIADELIKAQRRGVMVKIMIDAMINYEIESQALYARMRNAGIQIHGYVPAYDNYTNFFDYKGRYIDFFVNNNFRNHEKLFAIDPMTSDNAYGIVGGSNISNPYFRINPKSYRYNWTDQDVLLRGDIVTDIANLVERNIADYEKETPTSNTAWDRLLSYAQSQIGRFSTKQAAIDQINEIIQAPHILDQVTWSPSTIRLVGNRPKQDERYIQDFNLEHIANAQDEIVIVNTSFIPNNELLDALAAATSRGVKLKILTNSADTGDFDEVVIASHMRMKDLFAHPQANIANVYIYEWGGGPRKGNSEGLNHSKFMIFDRSISIVGSYNIDPRSDNLNSESIVIFDGVQATADLHDWFETCIDPAYSDRITLEIAVGYNDPTDVMGQMKQQYVKQIIPIL